MRDFVNLNECVHNVKQAALKHFITLMYQVETWQSGQMMMLYFSQVFWNLPVFLKCSFPKSYSDALIQFYLLKVICLCLVSMKFVWVSLACFLLNSSKLEAKA